MSNGVLFIVFGEKYYNMAIKTIAYSRHFTDLPFFIITNIRENKFDTISNTVTKYIPLTTEMNRHIKTSMINYSPFDRTIYIDCDAVIQKKGIEKAFELLDNHDIMLNIFGVWNKNNLMSCYDVAMNMLKETFPITIYYGAFIAFNKNSNSHDFFKSWNKNWIKTGIAREMPSLACTVKKMKSLKVKAVECKDNIFSWKVNKNAVIQHEYGNSKKFWAANFPGVLN